MCESIISVGIARSGCCGDGSGKNVRGNIISGISSCCNGSNR